MRMSRSPGSVQIASDDQRSWIVRAVQSGDAPFLCEMLYEAAMADPQLQHLPKADVLARPVIARYLVGWGRPGDAGVVAAGLDGCLLGAAWCRLYGVDERGEGIVAWSDTPELAIGVRFSSPGPRDRPGVAESSHGQGSRLRISPALAFG
jgi:hypothetical protein